MIPARAGNKGVSAVSASVAFAWRERFPVQEKGSVGEFESLHKLPQARLPPLFGSGVSRGGWPPARQR